MSTERDAVSRSSDWYCAPQVLGSIPVSCLFYPNACDDIAEPVGVFVGHVTDFWFSDISYHRDHLQVPILSGPRHRLVKWEYRAASIRDDQPTSDAIYQGQEPFVLTEHYLDVPTNTAFRVHRTRRRSPSAMRSEVPRIGVFFFRNDHTEGSQTVWLTGRPNDRGRHAQLICEVVGRMPSGSLIVTDGSKCLDWERNSYRPFIRYARQACCSDAPPDLRTVPPFSDAWGNRFTCVGFLGLRRGTRALIWQVERSSR